MTTDNTAKTRLAVRWLGAGLALIVVSCVATVFSPVIHGAVLLSAAVCVAMGTRRVWDTLQRPTS